MLSQFVLGTTFIALISCVEFVFAYAPAAYGIGKEGFDSYRAMLPKDYNVVAEGGWDSLRQRYYKEVGEKKLSQLSDIIRDEIDLVNISGGKENLLRYAADPKAELVQMIIENLDSNSGRGDYKDMGKVDALVTLLRYQGKGFNSVTVDGDWTPVLTRQGKKSTITQKVVGKREKAKNSFSNFAVKHMEFENLAYTPRGHGVLKALVKYNPTAANFDKIKGKIVLRRISCDITGVWFKYWKLPKVTLPLKKKGGYLDFLYLDDDIRVTRGNKGGLFVHVRPSYLDQVMNRK